MEPSISEVTIEEAKKKWEEKTATFLDIRDPQSYEIAHIPEAHHVDEQKAKEIISEWDKSQELIVYCYHGNTSYGVAGYFIENGFINVSSMSGGFEVWKISSPITQ